MKYLVLMPILLSVCLTDAANDTLRYGRMIGITQGCRSQDDPRCAAVCLVVVKLGDSYSRSSGVLVNIEGRAYVFASAHVFFPRTDDGRRKPGPLLERAIGTDVPQHYLYSKEQIRFSCPSADRSGPMGHVTVKPSGPALIHPDCYEEAEEAVRNRFDFAMIPIESDCVARLGLHAVTPWVHAMNSFGELRHCVAMSKSFRNHNVLSYRADVRLVGIQARNATRYWFVPESVPGHLKYIRGPWLYFEFTRAGVAIERGDSGGPMFCTAIRKGRPVDILVGITTAGREVHKPSEATLTWEALPFIKAMDNLRGDRDRPRRCFP